jgi:hypothetical protein
MNIREDVERFRKLHQETRAFLEEWKQTLELVASSDPAERRRGLAGLQAMDSRLVALCRHCREEEAEDARLQLYLSDEDLTLLRAEHSMLERMTGFFRAELNLLTTPPPAADLAAHGRELHAAFLRHVELEDRLLGEIEAGTNAVEEFLLDSSVLPG